MIIIVVAAIVIGAGAATAGPRRPMTKLGYHATTLSQLEPDQDVEHANENHRRDKEDKGTDLECVAHRRVLDSAQHTVRDVHHSELTGLWQSGGEGEYPDAHNELHRPGELGHGLLPKGMTYRYVALDGEGTDSEDRDIGRGLRQQPLEHTNGAAEGILRRVPGIV